MTINEKQRTEILRLHLAEHWRVGTISRELDIHHSAVERVISQAGMSKPERTTRASIIDPYLPFITETLQQHPDLSAARLYQMAVLRGYPGGASHFRQWVAQMRPRKLPEAFLRLKTLPGEQAQMDWGSFGHLQIGRATRPLMAFVMVLSDSRQIFLRYFLNAQMPSFLQGHVEAFNAFGGVPRIILYDNLKSAVKFRHGQWIEFNPTFTNLQCHYCFEPKPVGVARGNEKGRVERSIRYIRDNFFAARHFKDLDDLNRQAQHWCETVAGNRRCPGDTRLTVREAFEAEKPKLMALPDNALNCEHQGTVRVGKTPWARFDLNDYSVSYTHVRKPLTVRATETEVRLLDGVEQVACHVRSWDRGQQLENPEHTRELRERKRAAKTDHATDRLVAACPRITELLGIVQQRKQGLSKAIKALQSLLDDYGSAEFAAAVSTALDSQTYHVAGIQLVLEQRRESRDQPPLIALSLPQKARAELTQIKIASLADYDQILKRDDTNQQTEEPQT